MRTTLVLAMVVAVALSVVVEMPVHKKISLKSKMIKHREVASRNVAARHRGSRFLTKGTGSQPLSDYSDDYYLGNVTIGTPPQHFTVAIDMTSADLWVVACKNTAARTPKNCFAASKSSTYKKDGLKFGPDDYTKGTDTFTLAGLTYSPQGFIVWGSSRESIDDGVLGLGWPSLATGGITPPFQNLIKQLDQPIFTIWLDRHVKEATGQVGGLITYGALDTKNCDTQVDYVPLSAKADWRFSINGFVIGTYSTIKRYEVSSTVGEAWLTVPTAAINAIVKATGAQYNHFRGVYTAPCKGKYPDMVFTIGGKDYAIPSTEYLIYLESEGPDCTLTLYEEQGPGFGPDFTFGDTWIRTYCNIYDVGQGRIGFAKAHHAEI